MSYPSYNLRNVNDFISVVTADNIDNLLDNFKKYLMFVKTNQYSELISLNKDCFTWIDDGKSEIIIKINPVDTINTPSYSQTRPNIAQKINKLYEEDIAKIIEKYGNCITINNNIIRISLDDEIYDVIFDSYFKFTVKLVKFRNLSLETLDWEKMDRTDSIYVNYCNFSGREIDTIYDLINAAKEYMEIIYEYH